MADSQSTSQPAFLQDDAFGHWLSGFTDGEGCFYLGKKTVKRQPNYWQPISVFIIQLRADDLEIIQTIQNYFECGSISHVRGRMTRQGDKPKVDYRVYSVTDLSLRVIPHFDKYPLRAKKHRDFVIWKEAVSVMLAARIGCHKQRPHWSISLRNKFADCHDRLRNCRSFSHIPRQNSLAEYIQPSLF